MACSLHQLGMLAQATGDYDEADPWLQRYDIIVTTNEKADSLLRHRAKWMDEITLVVADEIHLLNEAERGPTLEIVLARLMQVNPDIQILALSATILTLVTAYPFAFFLTRINADRTYGWTRVIVSYHDPNGCERVAVDRDDLAMRAFQEALLRQPALGLDQVWRKQGLLVGRHGDPL